MVARNFYDVIVIGTQLGPLLTAALVARRGFRVLVLAHDDQPWTYEWEGHLLQREPFMISGASSPAVRRVLSELSLTQIFRRRTTPLAPYFQVVLPRHRVDFGPEPELFAREIEREFPEVKQAIEVFYEVLEQSNSELDELFAADLVLPPETFFERRDLNKAVAHNPFSKARGPFPLFGRIAPEHPFRRAVEAQVRWASDLALDDNPLQTVRLHSAWVGGTASIEGGLQGLKDLVLERIATHSGDVRTDLRADAIALRRGRVAGVRMAGQDEVTGCNFVLMGADAHQLPSLVDPSALGRSFVERLPQVEPVLRRYTLNVIVDAEVVPEGMARNVLFISEPTAPFEGENLLRIELCGEDESDTRLLCVGALLPERDAANRETVAGMRERVLGRLRWLVPFLDRHLIAVDSPHDGRKLQDIRGGREVALGDRWSRSPERMATICRADPPGVLGITGVPHRTGVKNLLMGCRQVVPGLGMEGEFLTALGASRIITKGDRHKRKFAGSRWRKIDL